MVSDNARSLPYGSDRGAPPMVIPDKDKFVTETGSKAKNFLYRKLLELREEYDRLMKLAEDTDMIYNAEYRFEPKTGKEYYLYRRENGTTFLSLVRPDEWNTFEFVGAYIFSSDGTWQEVQLE